MTHQQAIDGLASERYLLDEMSEIERYDFEAHYFDCATCAEDVRRGQLIREEAQRAGAIAPAIQPARGRIIKPARWWQRPMIVAPWAAAAAVAVLASYQSLVTVPELRGAMAPQALDPIMLRGAIRGGNATVVKINPGQRFVALTADVMADAAVRSLQYELRHADRSVLSGQAPIPSSSAPLLLLIPADEVRQAGRYVLIIRRADQPTAVIGEYEFDVSY